MAISEATTDNTRRPLYETVRERLRARCLSGAGAGTLPPLRELSATLGVNHLTVSRALRDLESDGLVQIVPRKGIFITAKAPAATEIVTLWSHHQNLAEISLQAHKGMLSAAGEARVTGTTLSVPPIPDGAAFVETLRARGTAGIALLGFGYLDQADALHEAQFLHDVAQQMPLVLLGKEHNFLALDCVYCDPRPQLRAFLEKCRAKGYERFAYLGANVGLSHLRQRFETFRDFLIAHGIACRPEHVPDDGATPAETSARLLDVSPAPQVVVTANLSRAYSLVLEAQRRGLEPRRDLEIMCFASSAEQARSILPYATVVLQDEEEVGRRAMTRLLERLQKQDGETPHIITVPARFMNE